jgi:hypothetical protein
VIEEAVFSKAFAVVSPNQQVGILLETGIL